MMTQVYPCKTAIQLEDDIETLYQAEVKLRAEGGREYASNANAFDNFNRVAVQLEIEPEMAVMAYLLKHIDGIGSYVRGHESQREDVTGRIMDARVYLGILHSMILSRREGDDV